MTDTKKNSALADPVPAKMTELVELLRQIRPQYGAVGSRDVDVAEQQRKIDAAIAAIESRALSSAAPQEPVGECIGWACRHILSGQTEWHLVTDAKEAARRKRLPNTWEVRAVAWSGAAPAQPQEQPVAAQQQDLHAAIMNLQCFPYPHHSQYEATAYRQGHKDARHAAAELVSAQPQEQPVAAQQQDEMREKLLEYLSMILDAKEAMLSAGIPQNDFQTMFAEFAAKAAPQQEAGQARELPPLPQPAFYYSTVVPEDTPTFTADQMHEYARAAQSAPAQPWLAAPAQQVEAEIRDKALEEAAKEADHWQNISTPNHACGQYIAAVIRGMKSAAGSNNGEKG